MSISYYLLATAVIIDKLTELKFKLRYVRFNFTLGFIIKALRCAHNVLLILFIS